MSTMDHEEDGADWTSDGVVGKCTCGWRSTPVPIGRGWIENLNAQYQQHLQEVSTA